MIRSLGLPCRIETKCTLFCFNFGLLSFVITTFQILHTMSE